VGRGFGGVVAVAAVLCLALGCKVDLNDEIEQLLGSMSAKSLEAEYAVDEDPLMNAYITRMGKSLVAVSGRPNLPYSFKVLDTDQVNAMAAPYGHLYVFKGLLDLVDTEDELAAVLGHEVTHVVARHSLKSFKESLLFDLVLSSFKNKKYNDAKTVLAIGNLFRELRYSRVHEHEADYHGAHDAILARYDPAGAPGFFGKLLAKYGGGRPSRLESIFSTHPVSTDRISRTQNLDWIQKDNPRYVDSMLSVAKGYVDRSRFAGAAKYFEAALRAVPNSADAHLGLAVALAGQGKLAESREQFRRVAEQSPDQPGVKEAQQQIEFWARADTDSSPVSSGTRTALLAMAPGLRQVSADANTADSSIQRPSAANLRSADTAARALAGTRSVLGSLVKALPEAVDKRRDPLLSVIGDTNSLTEQAIGEVEAAASRGLETTGTLARVASLLADRMQDPPDEVSARELLRAAQDLLANTPETLSLVRTSVEAAQEAAKFADRATEASAQAAKRLWDTRAESSEDFERNYADRVEADAEGAREAAKEATRRSKRARELTIRGRFRAVAAEADAVTAAANPFQRQVLDGILAHYLMVEPTQVTALRQQQSLGGADRLMALGEAQQNKRPIDTNRSWQAFQWTNLVDQYHPPRLDNLAILAKLFVNAAKSELGLASGG
jgi:tetratricopeptide (TPR) repeat protein